MTCKETPCLFNGVMVRAILYGEESWERDWVWVYEFKRVEV